MVDGSRPVLSFHTVTHRSAKTRSLPDHGALVEGRDISTKPVTLYCFSLRSDQNKFFLGEFADLSW